ncbi:MAG: caspase family protein [Betaproteobacteria bacterium]|nr:caspase family protein [Betaproteobacteria bacterium]
MLIGLGKYESGASKGLFRDLPVAANDLEAVANALERLGFDQIEIYSDLMPPIGSRFDFRSLLIPGDSPSLPINSLHVDRLINDRLIALEETEENDLLLIYFTGHGGIFGKADRVLAVPDSRVSTPNSFVQVKHILNIMADRANSTDKFLVVDACADQLKNSAELQGTKTDEELPDYLYSSKLGEMSFFDRHLGISVFTHYFVEALVRADELGIGDVTGKIESHDIKNYVRRYVPLHTDMEQKKPQRPKNVPLVQHPLGSGSQNLVLTQYKVGTKSPLPDSEATAAQREIYLRSIQETYYGDAK